MSRCLDINLEILRLIFFSRVIWVAISSIFIDPPMRFIAVSYPLRSWGQRKMSQWSEILFSFCPISERQQSKSIKIQTLFMEVHFIFVHRLDLKRDKSHHKLQQKLPLWWNGPTKNETATMNHKLVNCSRSFSLLFNTAINELEAKKRWRKKKLLNKINISHFISMSSSTIQPEWNLFAIFSWEDFSLNKNNSRCYFPFIRSSNCKLYPHDLFRGDSPVERRKDAIV